MILPSIVFILCVVLPVLLWLKLFRWEDRAEPEPKRILLKTFLFGALTAICLAVGEFLIFRLLFGDGASQQLSVKNLTSHSLAWQGFAMLMLAGFLEETGKFLVLKEYVYDKTEFNQILDGVIYGATLALGFSFVENIFYFYDFLKSGQGTVFFVAATTVRGIFSISLHVLATSISGLALGRKKFRVPHSWGKVWLAVLAAGCLHALFNSSIQFGLVGLFVAVLLLVLAARYVFKALNLPESKVVWKLVVPPAAPQGEVKQ